MTDRPPPRRLPRAQREQQILDVAHAQFAEQGYSAVTMNGVAAAVGVTKPLLYTYFGNKEQLYLACLGRTGDGLVAALDETLRGATSPGDALKDCLRAFLGFVEHDRGAWQVLYDETLPAGGEIARHVTGYRDRLVDLVGAAVLQLSPAPTRTGAIEARAVAHALLGGAEALARWWLHTDALPAAQAAELFIDTVEPGLERRARRGRATANGRPGARARIR